MPTRFLLNRTFDARPDRIDFRDLLYRPPLANLPDQYPLQSDIDKYFPQYQRDGMALDQGEMAPVPVSALRQSSIICIGKIG
jgi:hypothetical protein